jgi:hypothetical protein
MEDSMKRVVIVSMLMAGLSALGLPAQNSAPKPGPEHKKLAIWVGDWTYEGEAHATPLGPAAKYVGKATARPILGGFFVEWRIEQKGPSGRSQTYGVDCYNAINQRYTWTGFTSEGGVDSLTYTIDGTTVNNSGTMLRGEQLYKIRSIIVFADDFMSMVEKMEISFDGQTWTPYFQNYWNKSKKNPQKIEKAK